MYCREATHVDTTSASAHYNLGVLKAEEGDDDGALAEYQNAISLQPNYGEALCNVGVMRRKQGRLQDALHAHEACYKSMPHSQVARESYAVALSERAASMCLNDEGTHEEQMQMHFFALSLSPLQSRCLYNAAVACSMHRKRSDTAAFLYGLVVHFDPSCGQAWNALGSLKQQANDLHAAQDCFVQACAADSTLAEPRNKLGMLLTMQGRCMEAQNAFETASQIDPDNAECDNNLGVLFRDLGESENALEQYRTCLQKHPDNRAAGQNLLLQLNYVMGGECSEVSSAHKRWGERFEQLYPPIHRSPREPAPGVSRPIRVGYLSPDLCIHSVSYFAEAPLRAHSSSRVNVVVYSCTTKADERNSYLQRIAKERCGAHWRDCSEMSELEIAKQIDEDRIDILVELTGHTACNRLDTVARKPAPVQVTWIGYPNSTGLSTVDYRITDSVCDPVNSTQEFTEQLVRLHPCFLCYSPPQRFEEYSIAPLPANSAGSVTFGSFNALAKTRDSVLRCWGRILHSVPQSRLVMKAKAFADPQTRKQYLHRAEQNGIPSHRLDLLPLAAETKDHLEAYNSVDISLDSFPYGGTTTTCESLLMGVPCVTLTGSCHAHNVGASLLQSVGLDDWIATSEAEYVNIACSAASQLNELARLRSELRNKLLSSPLCDCQVFVRQLEERYEHMMRSMSVPDEGVTGNGHEKPEKADDGEESRVTSEACSATVDLVEDDDYDSSI